MKITGSPISAKSTTPSQWRKAISWISRITWKLIKLSWSIIWLIVKIAILFVTPDLNMSAEDRRKQGERERKELEEHIAWDNEMHHTYHDIFEP